MGNKEKGHAFVERRKRIALKEYKKLLKKTRGKHKCQMTKLRQMRESKDAFPMTNRKQKPVNKLTAAESEFKKRRVEKEKLHVIKEREVVIQKHREEVREKMKKRRETFGRLNLKKRKGQPVMTNQIEHLLGKIVMANQSLSWLIK